jgi:hypothetical protein
VSSWKKSREWLSAHPAPPSALVVVAVAPSPSATVAARSCAYRHALSSAVGLRLSHPMLFPHSALWVPVNAGPAFSATQPRCHRICHTHLRLSSGVPLSALCGLRWSCATGHYQPLDPLAPAPVTPDPAPPPPDLTPLVRVAPSSTTPAART